MYRLHFTAEDLTRTCIASASDPFLETMLGAELLRHRATGLVYRAWRLGLRGRLDAGVRPLASLIPRDGRGLDLPTLIGPVTEFVEWYERFLGVRRVDLRRELEWLVECRRFSASPALVDDDRTTRNELATAITAFHETAIQPHWRRIHDVLQTDRRARMRCMAQAGIGRLFATLCPGKIRWRHSTLELTSRRHRDIDIELGGRGLVLVPSVFVGDDLYVAIDLTNESAMPRLIYPVLRDLADADRLWAATRAGHGLAELLGRTRSAVLEAVADGHGTVEIARRLGVSAATVSEHLSILRTSGLVTTRRDGALALHTLTLAGEALRGAHGRG